MQISVIIPTYAPGAYIYDCLNSLLVQTSGYKLLETIIVLNGIRDPYFSNIHSYLTQHGFRFKLLYTEEKGVSNARNIGLDSIELCDSQYVVFLDDDDKLSPNFIDEVAREAQPHIVVASNNKNFFGGLNSVKKNGYISNCYENNINVSYNIFTYRCFLSTVWGKLFPLSVIGKTRFNTSFSIGEDSLFAFAISNKIKRIVLTNRHTFYLRQIRANSASRIQKSRLTKLRNKYRLCKAYSKIYFKNPCGYNFLFFTSRIIATIIHK
jgi:glycosyltransferase involved in cell wall biosynthesis